MIPLLTERVRVHASSLDIDEAETTLREAEALLPDSLVIQTERAWLFFDQQETRSGYGDLQLCGYSEQRL